MEEKATRIAKKFKVSSFEMKSDSDTSKVYAAPMFTQIAFESMFLECERNKISVNVESGTQWNPFKERYNFIWIIRMEW